MNSNINLIAFGTFGHPNGFTQTFFLGNSSLSKSIRTFDINTSALNLFPGSKVYAIRKDFVSGKNIIAYSIYTYAREQNSTRGGTFIGSSILFIDKIAEEDVTINCLNEFHSHLKNKNVENDIIKVTHSNNFSVEMPRDFDKINFHLRGIEVYDFVQVTNKQMVVYCETNPASLQTLFKNSVDLLNVYDTIYFTESAEVAEFVHQKKIFTLLKREAFEEKVQAFQEEVKRRTVAAVSSFEKEMQYLNDDKAKTLKYLRDQIEQNINLHKENERKINESKRDLEKMERIYNDFSLNIKGLTDEIKSGKKLEVTTRIYNEKKLRFTDGVHQLKKPVLIDPISKGSEKPEPRVKFQYQKHEDNYQRNRSKEENKEHKINRFKVITIMLLVLLIGSWVYFLFFSKQEESMPTKSQQQNASLYQVQIPL